MRRSLVGANWASALQRWGGQGIYQISPGPHSLKRSSEVFINLWAGARAYRTPTLSKETWVPTGPSWKCVQAACREDWAHVGWASTGPPMPVTASVLTSGSGTWDSLPKLQLRKQKTETWMNERRDEWNSSNYDREDWGFGLLFVWLVGFVCFLFVCVLALILTQVLGFLHPLPARLRNIRQRVPASCSFSSPSYSFWLLGCCFLLLLPHAHPILSKNHFPTDFIHTHFSVRKILLGFLEIHIALLIDPNFLEYKLFPIN